MSSIKTKIDGSNLLENLSNDTENCLKSIANQAGSKAKELLHCANSGLSNASDTVVEEIRGNPIRSSAIALGAGIIIGIVLRNTQRLK
jgi:ElaB/YqjD/DUF883 family membrane-anchored ribosome-binding protein